MEAMMQGIETGLFQAAAHPDRSFRNKKDWDADCEAVSRQFFSVVSRHNVILEKNISSMEMKNYYRDEFWALMPENIRTVPGLDAHSVKEMEARCVCCDVLLKKDENG